MTTGYASNLVVGSRNTVSDYGFSLAYAHPAGSQQVFHGFMVKPDGTPAPVAVDDTAAAQVSVFNPGRQRWLRHSAIIPGSSFHIVIPVGTVPTPTRFDIDSNTDLLLPTDLMQRFTGTGTTAMERLEMTPLDLNTDDPPRLQVFAASRETASGQYNVAFRDYDETGRRPRYASLNFSNPGTQPTPVRTAAVVANATAYGVATIADPPRMFVARRVRAMTMPANTHPDEAQLAEVRGAFVTDNWPLKADEALDSRARPLAVTFIHGRLLVAVPRMLPPVSGGNTVVLYSINPQTGDSMQEARLAMGNGEETDVRLSFQNFSGESTALLLSYREGEGTEQDGVVRLLRIAKRSNGALGVSAPLQLNNLPDFTSSTVSALGPFEFDLQTGVAFCSVRTQVDVNTNPRALDDFKCHSLLEAAQ